MSELICSNPKTYALSKNKKYNTIHETEKMVTVVNDKGIAANYHKDLFTNEVTWEINDEILQFNNGNRISLTDSLSTSTISCGISEHSEINDLVASIVNNIEDDEKQLDCFVDVLNFYKTRNAMVLFSTAIEEGIGAEVNRLFEHAEHEVNMDTSDNLINPNSGNRIAMWTLYRD
jgi:hypothetical protein